MLNQNYGFCKYANTAEQSQTILQVYLSSPTVREEGRKEGSREENIQSSREKDLKEMDKRGQNGLS